MYQPFSSHPLNPFDSSFSPSLMILEPKQTKVVVPSGIFDQVDQGYLNSTYRPFPQPPLALIK
jgi:hypothetical protein